MKILEDIGLDGGYVRDQVVRERSRHALRWMLFRGRDKVRSESRVHGGEGSEMTILWA